MSGSDEGLAGLADSVLMLDTMQGFFPSAYVATWIGGMVCVEGARAIFRFPDDPLYLRVMVAFTTVIALTYTGLFGQVLYDSIVQNFGNFRYLTYLTNEFSLHVCISRLAISIPHYFFGHRLWVLSHNWWVSALVMACATAHFGVSLYISWAAFHYPNWIIFAHECANDFRLMYALAVSTDLFTTAGLVYYLRQVQKEHEHNQNIMRKLLILTFETNGATLLLAVVSLVVVGQVGVGVLYGLTYISGQLYLLSLLISLNSRTGLRESARRQALLADVESRRAKNPFMRPPNPLEGIRVERIVITDVEADAGAEKLGHRVPVRVRRDPLALWLGGAAGLRSPCD